MERPHARSQHRAGDAGAHHDACATRAAVAISIDIGRSARDDPAHHGERQHGHAGPSISLHAARQGHGFIVRALWFVAIGWWLAALMIAVGYVLAASLILLLLGLWFLHRVPQAQTLRHRTREFTSELRNGALVFTEGTVAQVAWYWRLLYLPIGLVFGAVWLVAAWILSVLIITLPLSIWMIDWAPGAITLQRH